MKTLDYVVRPGKAGAQYNYCKFIYIKSNVVNTYWF